ncbi:conserved hypothetical protein [Ricinus communis]|uniref:Uncharacterized protein n=1 Tax=Ricinus communis TaxID=3988 RepID=B9RBP5_RICCO|nr:conserved hypothetical protein [Ricinus communis]
MTWLLTHEQHGRRAGVMLCGAVEMACYVGAIRYSYKPKHTELDPAGTSDSCAKRTFQKTIVLEEPPEVSGPLLCFPFAL